MLLGWRDMNLQTKSRNDPRSLTLDRPVEIDNWAGGRVVNIHGIAVSPLAECRARLTSEDYPPLDIRLFPEQGGDNVPLIPVSLHKSPLLKLKGGV